MPTWAFTPSVRNILAVHDTALALVGTAHLARLKGYSCKFMQLLTQRYDAESGLRSPSVLEAQHADRQLWQSIYALVEKGSSVNDAIYEFAEIRSDMTALLQPKARASSNPK